MFHLDEDRQIEAAMDAADLQREERAAEYLSENSFEDAVNDYRAMAEDGTIFEDAFGGPDPVSWGERLADRLNRNVRELAFGIVPFELLNETEHAVLFDALILPFDIHYFEYAWVGSGGNAQSLGDPAERDRFEEDERWTSCEETDIRTAVVDAAFSYCVSAAALAKHLNATCEQRKLLRALRLINRHCKSPDCEPGGMSKSEAGLVCSWLMDATESLWAHSTAEAKLAKWFPKTNDPEPTPGEKRADELLARSLAGTVTQEEADELMHANDGEVESPAQDEGNEDGMFEPIEPSPYAADFIRVDNATHTIYIKGKVLTGKNKGAKTEKPFLVPSGYVKGWQILKLLIESTGPAGSYQFTEEQRNLSDGWRTHIYHGRGEDLQMKELRRYIHSTRDAGRPMVKDECRGLCCLRISPTPKTKPNKKPRKKSSSK